MHQYVSLLVMMVVCTVVMMVLRGPAVPMLYHHPSYHRYDDTREGDPPFAAFQTLEESGYDASQRKVTPTSSGSREVVLEPGDSHLPYENLVIANLSGTTAMDFPEPGPLESSDQPPLKKILFWNDVFGVKHYAFGFGREPFIRAGCRVNTCFTTSDRTRFPPDQIDALIWHWRSEDRSLPINRLPHARYVFWLYESPSYMFGNIKPYKDLFNWTLTYRLDSDFPNPYGRVYRRHHPLPDTDRNYAEGKTKLAAWFVSNCNTSSGREQVVEVMRRWLPVDAFGDCGTLRCPKEDHGRCKAMLNKEYKFYLAFENSLCRDYVTEKFFERLDSLDVIPVVYGLGNYSSQAPPHSYIDALSFPSVKALADYLLYLHHNDTAYNEYFRWKRYHTVSLGWPRESRVWCQLCERLHTDTTTTTTTQTYDLYQWFVQDARCLTKTSRRITTFIQGK